eukprot:CAMPEP_0114253348 /NCGR_PEP_ID=MMETSP0058-20121206/16338_1 /TAXON_ID=36894 /ORGANISM="Pyramimonas parkeae, CCMP726" /LENGTH=49 /DNA_ID= /DNA_START= /DNA_END= /DNA_ORIENTATION=
MTLRRERANELLQLQYGDPFFHCDSDSENEYVASMWYGMRTSNRKPTTP